MGLVTRLFGRGCAGHDAATGGLALALAWILPAHVAGASGCPVYWQDRPLRCARGYVQASPAGFMVPLGDVRDQYAESPRLGYEGGVGAGMFRAFGRFGLAVGGRFAYAFTRQRFSGFSTKYQYFHVGPELRLGRVSERIFAFGLVRVGWSQWHEDYAERLSLEQTEWVGPHIGGGAGVWGRLGSRFMIGSQVALDLLISDSTEVVPLTLSLSLGLWL